MPTLTIISLALLFKAAMDFVNSSMVASLQRFALTPVEIMPVPIFLVRIRASPGLAFELSRILSG
jgi:hypothetical protein